jgi:lipoprotein-releasing system permease protein
VYKLLLCLRYLRTRYLAFVCVVSVLLGVATLIVVNSVMSGFSNKLKTQLHGASSDLTMHTEESGGFPYTAADIERRIAATPAGPYVQAVSPVVDYYAMLQFQLRGPGGRLMPITKMVRIQAIDPEQHAKVGKFADYLVNNKGNPGACFTPSAEALRRFDQNRTIEAWERQEEWLKAPPPAPAFPPADPGKNPFGMPIPAIAPRTDEGNVPAVKPDMPAPAAPARLPGIVLGFSIAHSRWPNKDTGAMEDHALLLPGDDVFVATIGASGTRPVSANFVVTDYLKSEMSEYDGNTVFVPLAELQRLRAMDDKVNSLQIRLTEEVRGNPAFVHGTVVPAVQSVVPRAEGALVQSWWQQQGPLFAAIDIERGLLNVLLFLIVGVAGFGVLAIFSMIVAEKYRDIGILKSLGASGGGVMGIFVGYGLLLGVIGCVFGTALGLWITANINQIEHVLTALTGREVFDRKIYYFDQIPTNVDALTVVLVNAGAVAISVVSSLWPAARAARLQPVRALRFE